MTYYIEDLLHILVDNILIADGVKPVNDLPILSSISRQCKKGVALTDRQYELVKNKLYENASLLQEYNVHLDDNPPRLPLRKIDRSKYIKLTSTEDVYADQPYESYKSNYKWIKVRFPFNKKDIVKLESVVSNCINSRKRHREYRHKKGTHEHFFLYNSYTVYNLLSVFENRNFEIDNELFDIYNQVKLIVENKTNYIPYVQDDEFKNLNSNAIDILKQEVDDYNSTILKDRSLRFGYTFENYNSNGSLADTIVTRNNSVVLADPQKYNINQIASAIHDLNRFPLVVIIDQDSCADQLLEIHRAFNYLVEDTQQSVLFRVDSDDDQNSYVNQYIKDNNLNNWVDKDTKIVYIKKNKLPKALLTSDFRPVAVLGKTSMRNNSQVETYINFNCDLIVYHDNQENLFGKYSRKYGIM